MRELRGGMDVLAPGSVGSALGAGAVSSITLMHGHELYYALAAAYSQIHLSSHWVIYLFVSTICQKSSHVKEKEKKQQPNKIKKLRSISSILPNGYLCR